jgi:transposase
MSQIKRIGLDTSKAVFTLHCVDESGHAVLRTNLRRAQMATFFKNLAPAEITLEGLSPSTPGRSPDALAARNNERPDAQ